MKNIVWQLPSGDTAVTNLSPDSVSTFQASAMKNSGSVPGNWFPIAYDVELTTDQAKNPHALQLDGSGNVVLNEAKVLPIRWAAYKAQAQALLDKSDLTALRCFKAGITFPTEWHDYVTALRAIVSASTGNPDLPLPTTPTYPFGS